MNKVIENILSRRSVRAYEEEQLKTEELEAILQSATFAPSGMNSQSWLFTVVQNTEKLSALNEEVKEVLKTTNRNPHLVLNDQYKFYYNAPTLVIVTNKRDYVNAMADSSAAIENMLLSSASLNIGSCWINQLTSTSDVPAIRAILSEMGIPDDHVVYGAVSLGYAKAESKAAPRKEGTINWVK